MYESNLKLEYTSKYEYTGKSYSLQDEFLPEEKIVMEIPTADLNTIQLFKFFTNFLRAIGHNDVGIMKGACSIAFNECNKEEDMRKIAEEYDLMLMEDVVPMVETRVQEQLEIEKKINQQSSGDCMPPWGHSDTEALKYSEEELNAMCDAAEEKEKCREYNLREAEYYNKRAQLDVEHDNSNKNMWEQGVMKVTTNDPMKAWNGYIPGSPEARAQGCICPVLDNEDMPDDKKWIDVECPIHGRKKP